MNSIWINSGTGLLAVVLLAGCTVTSTPNQDAKFGEAVNMAKAQQTINPDASKDRGMVRGVDGEAANAIIDRYHKAYETPAPAPSGSVGSIGGAGTTLK